MVGAMAAPSDIVGRFSVRFVGHTSLEGHTTYVIQVTGPDGTAWNIQKRYSEIRNLHDELRLRYGDALPSMPGKRLWGNSDPAFVAARQGQLQQYLEGVLQLEREVRTLALLQFLGGPEPGTERTQTRQYEQIIDGLQSQLLNLALEPALLDQTEMAQKVKRYGQAMRLHALSQPVDPIHLRAPGFDKEPLQLCSSNGDHFDALKSPVPASASDGRILKDLLDGLQQVLWPPQPITDPERLIVPFPPIDRT